MNAPSSSRPLTARSAEADLAFASVIVELAPDGIVVCDDNGVMLMANHQVENLFGYDRDDLIGAPVETLQRVRFRAAHQTERAGYITEPKTRPMGIGLDLLGRHADGSEFPIEISLSPVASGHGTAIIAVIRETSRQRASELAARATLVIDEDERIAADLHDRVIGHLFGAGLTVASILGRDRVDSEVAERLHNVIDELDNAARQIRKTAFALARPRTGGRAR